MSAVSIRAAARSDLPAVLKLYAQPTIDDGAILPLEAAQAVFERFRAYPDYTLYVAVEAGGAVVGSFALLVMDNIGHLGAPSGLVEAVVVDPARHREGIGRRMMHFALARCREKGCYKMALSANIKRDKAHAFYESLGFQRHGYSFLVDLAVTPSPRPSRGEGRGEGRSRRAPISARRGG
ncbi:MAG: GNAT family N-acetyltransferase [Methylobacteriaceae bacterium]|nr:GNAT family N-acetyltransferase [Methylobacteriaceae bacterium]